MLLGRQEVSWPVTTFRDMFGAVLLLVSIPLLCGQSLCVLWDLSNSVWGQVNCFYKALLGQAVVQPCSNIRMFLPWVSAVVKRLPACEDKDSVNETVSTPTRAIALDDCLVSLLWSKSVFGDTLPCIVLIWLTWERKNHLLQPRSHFCADVLLPLGSRFLPNGRSQLPPAGQLERAEKACCWCAGPCVPFGDKAPSLSHASQFAGISGEIWAWTGVQSLQAMCSDGEAASGWSFISMGLFAWGVKMPKHWRRPDFLGRV